MHSHLLPGIDDGVNSFEESLAVIRILNSLGVDRFTVTPHIAVPGMHNTVDTILPLLEQLRSLLAAEGLDVTVDAAAEYRVIEGMIPLLDAPLMAAPDRTLLIEHNFMAPAPCFDQVLDRVQADGYFPVLAHPERYPFFQHDAPVRCRALRDRDCRVQVNLLSFAGTYGSGPEKNALRLLRSGQLDFVASDAHCVADAELVSDFLHSSSAAKLARFFRIY